MIHIKQKGDFSKFNQYCTKALKVSQMDDLERIAQKTIEELAKATPIDSGLTAKSWICDIVRRGNSAFLTFKNTNIQNGVNVALLLEYGHGTRNGGFVKGANYIDPVVQKNFLDVVDKTWKEVKEL